MGLRSYLVAEVLPLVLSLLALLLEVLEALQLLLLPPLRVLALAFLLLLARRARLRTTEKKKCKANTIHASLEVIFDRWRGIFP